MSRVLRGGRRGRRKEGKNGCGTWASEPLSKLLLPRAMRGSLSFRPRSERQSHRSSISQAPSVSQEIGRPGEGDPPCCRAKVRAEARDRRRPLPVLPPPARRKQASRTPCRSILSFPALSHAPSAHAPARGPAGARSPGLKSSGNVRAQRGGSTVNDRWALLGLRAQQALRKACGEVVSARACVLLRFRIQRGSKDLFNKIF